MSERDDVAAALNAGVPVGTFSHEEIADQIRHHCGKLRGDDEIDRLAVVMAEVLTLSEEEKDDFISACGAFFCTHCGSSYLPCYCMRDD